MTNLMNELAGIKIANTDNINDHIIRVNNQLEEIIFIGNILSEKAKCSALRSTLQPDQVFPFNVIRFHNPQANYVKTLIIVL